MRFSLHSCSVQSIDARGSLPANFFSLRFIHDNWLTATVDATTLTTHNFYEMIDCLTTIPSSTLVMQAGCKPLQPSTSTTHILQNFKVSLNFEFI